MTQNISFVDMFLPLLLVGLLGFFFKQKGDTLFTKETFLVGPQPYIVTPTQSATQDIVKDTYTYTYTSSTGIRADIVAGCKDFLIDVKYMTPRDGSEDIRDIGLDDPPESITSMREMMNVLIKTNTFDRVIENTDVSEILASYKATLKDTSETSPNVRMTRDSVIRAFERYFPTKAQDIYKYLRMDQHINIHGTS